MAPKLPPTLVFGDIARNISRVNTDDASEFISADQPPPQDNVARLRCKPHGASTEAVQHPVTQRAPRGWLWASTQLEPGELRVEHAALDFGNSIVATATINRASLHRLRAPAGCVSLLTRYSNRGALFVGGHELTYGRGLCMERGAEIELIAHPASGCLLISLERTPITHEAGWHPKVVGLGSGVALVGCSIDASVALEDGVRETLGSACCKDNFPAAELVRQIATAFLLGTAERSSDRLLVSSTRLTCRQRRAVEAARGYIRDHMPEPIRLEDLCRNTHLRARALEYGFRQVVRLSPMRYLRMLRLGEVRRELLKSSATQRSISEIALDAGFSHLSQFSVDYKKVFGETPSATRQRRLNMP